MEGVAAALRRHGDLVCKGGVRGHHRPELTNGHSQPGRQKAPRPAPQGGKVGKGAVEVWSKCGGPNRPGGGAGAAAAGGVGGRFIVGLWLWSLLRKICVITAQIFSWSVRK